MRTVTRRASDSRGHVGAKPQNKFNHDLDDQTLKEIGLVFQAANRAPPQSVTASAIAPPRMLAEKEDEHCFLFCLFSCLLFGLVPVTSDCRNGK